MELIQSDIYGKGSLLKALDTHVTTDNTNNTIHTNTDSSRKLSHAHVAHIVAE